MGHFLDVAFKVLTEAGRPLSPKEITEIGIQQGLLQTQGATPWQTMKSKLSTEILRARQKSAFMRTEQGKFGLRVWDASQFGEYVASRYQKALLDENVVVFPATSIRKYVPSPGLYLSPLSNGRDLIRECRPMLRRAAEEDYSVIQLVSVFVLRYENKYLTYKRTRRLPEQRLHGSYSAIFGGHLNPEDIPTLFDIFEPEVGSPFLTRELSEEVEFPPGKEPRLRYKGLVYDDSRDISKQHLGIAYDAILKTPEYRIGERGFLMDSKFETLDEIESHIQDFENWSVLIVGSEKGSR